MATFERRIIAFVLWLTACGSAQGQQSRVGRIVGRVIDARTGDGVVDVGIQVVGTTTGVQSGIDGRYSLVKVPAGPVTLHLRRLGYQPKTITGIFLDTGVSLEQNVTLERATVTLSTAIITASSERGTTSQALDQQRTAVGVVNGISAEQISKSPDADAAQSVQRVSGVTVEDGRYISVRGLGDRYTTASLNGARVPSPEPEKRVVPLDMFPAGLLQSITTTKTFTPDQQGDFAGALVDIRTREFPTRRALTAQMNGGYAAGTSGERVISGRNAGGERFAMASSRRSLPALVRSLGNFQGINLNQADRNLLVGQFRNAWTPSQVTASPNSSTALSVGGDDPILFGHRLGYLLSGIYSFGTDLQDKQVRALADRGNTPGETRTIDRFTGQTASQSVLWGATANLSTMLGTGSRMTFNGMYNRTADNDARVERGHFENEGIDAQITRMQYVERAVRSAQLAGEHQVGAHRLDWSATVSGVRRDEPDRSEFVQAIDRDASGAEVLHWLATGNEGAVRTFSSLDEASREGKLDYQLRLNALGNEHSLKVGGLARMTTRNADTRAYSISAPGAHDNVTSLPADQLFDGRFTHADDSVFSIAPLAQGGSYDARDHLGAGYVMSEIELSRRARLIGGARYELDHLTVDAFSTLGSPITTTKHWTDVLPSLALTYELSGLQQLRLSASRTVARPEYRELSSIKSRDVLNGDDTQGNEHLERSRIINADLRWEWYPRTAEVLSIGLFAKRFDKPIERVYQAAGSGTRTVFFTNAKSAMNYGVELEARAGLGFLGTPFTPFSVFSNATVMHSRITLEEDTRASATNTSRRMVGQAPYVVNAGLTYATSANAMTATLLYNRVGERIQAAGDRPLPDVIERARNALDLSIRFPVAGAFSARLDGKNILDEPYCTTQGTVVREEYRIGRVVQVGLLWQP